MALSNEQIAEAAIKKVNERAYGYDLWYVNHDDRLTDEQVEEVLAGDVTGVMERIFDALSETAYLTAVEAVEEVVKEVLTEYDAEWDDEDFNPDEAWDDFDCSDEFYTVREAVDARDESDPLQVLAGHTPDPLVQWIPDSPIEVDLSGVYGEIEERAEKEAQVEDVLRELGLPVTGHNVDSIHEAMRECHDYAEVRPIFTVDMAEMVDSSVKWVRVKDPILLLLNRFDGSGMDTRNMEGTITLTREDLRADSALGYGSWDNIAGVVRSAYTVDTEYVRICEYTFEGTDTDGTDYYRCHHHGNLEPSPDVHCDGATEPAYGRLIEKED